MVNQIVRVKPTAHRCRDFWSSIDYDFLEQFAGSMISRKSCKILFGVVGMVFNHVGMTFSVLRRLVGFEVVDVRMNARKDRLQQIQGAYEKCGRFLLPGLGGSHHGTGCGRFLYEIQSAQDTSGRGERQVGERQFCKNIVLEIKQKV